MFIGITALALTHQVHVARDPTDLGLPPGTPTSDRPRADRPGHLRRPGPLLPTSRPSTAGVLILAANTASTASPCSPRSSPGTATCPASSSTAATGWSSATAWSPWPPSPSPSSSAFHANVTAIIQLYIIGVFVSFTLSQAGMVQHWRRELARPARLRAQPHPPPARNQRRSAPPLTALVLAHRPDHQVHPWRLDRRHRDAAAVPHDEWHPPPLRPGRRRARSTPAGVGLPSRIHAIVLVCRLHLPTLRALAFARATRPHADGGHGPGRLRDRRARRPVGRGAFPCR